MSSRVGPKLSGPPGSKSPARTHDVLILGGSYSGMSALLTLLSLKDGQKIPLASYGDFSHLKEAPLIATVKITLLDKRDGFCRLHPLELRSNCFMLVSANRCGNLVHTVGLPLASISAEHANQMWIRYSEFSSLKRQDVRIVQGTALDIDTDSREVLYMNQEGKQQALNFDYLILATGICRQWPVASGATEKSAFLEGVSKYTEDIRAAQDQGVAVIGGGAVGVEFSGKIKALYPEAQVTLIHSGNTLLSKEALPREFKSRVLELLQLQGVDILLGERATVTTAEDKGLLVKLNSGSCMSVGFVIWAALKRSPSTQFLPRSLLNDDGSIKIDPQ
ncbi:hypothetical protein N7462_007719 [Penicillium macrosclerotiorum]|uniref:uncharacterized protein n=1 Tax=Penicillium macrosclerotiorum TaxID=303699 RepID=UPI0025476E42|nr:uncharacterized protein N7462_007719 [Penicillium macrosclerotiorum]KAJ5679475.1 hypothetical protein N7462_007719 [Penicillium macrosclerotiorum]